MVMDLLTCSDVGSCWDVGCVEGGVLVLLAKYLTTVAISTDGVRRGASDVCGRGAFDRRRVLLPVGPACLGGMDRTTG